MRDALSGDVERLSAGDALEVQSIIAESITPLWTPDGTSEDILVAGKIHNLRLAAAKLNGVHVTANHVFSFWKQVGRTSRVKGYVAGRELRQGCLIPSIGGGLCQLSNALYDAALRADCEIVERHAHSQVIRGSLAERGRDATVFWNYVDLRFKSTRSFRIEAALTAESLVVRFKGELGTRRQLFLATKTMSKLETPVHIGSCSTCATKGCFRRVRSPAGRTDFGRTAYLVDEYWPEFERYISGRKLERDLLCLPLDGKRYGRPNYAWSTAGFKNVNQSRVLTLKRAYQSRTLAAQGASRQRSLLAATERLARRYSSFLAHDVTHVTLMQHLVPFLWREGSLGGRTFDVLMTRLPLVILQERLDSALRLHPQSPTLGDFRADGWLIEAEMEALQQANKIITPHTEIAALYPDKSVLIDWLIPAGSPPVNDIVGGDARLVFPSATVGRKGIYELRDAMNGLDAELMVLGPILEDKHFWDGVRIVRPGHGEDWLRNAVAVVLPAFVEPNPRRLLEARARGVPIIATKACGVENVSGVTNVQLGNSRSLRAAIKKILSMK